MTSGTIISNYIQQLFGSPVYSFFFLAVLYFVLMKICVSVLPDLKST